MTPSIAVLAGDLSGDRAASLALGIVQSRNPDLSLFGFGGPHLAALGQEQLAELSSLAVLGFSEIVSKLRYFRQLERRCLDEIKRRRPSVVVLVDYPGFNLRLLPQVRALNIPVVYLIPPQVWAWGEWRVKKLRECNELLVMLPFEEDFYRRHQLPVSFVGHYLLDEIAPDQILSPRPEQGPLALLPGSRPGEVHRHLPLLLATAQLLTQRGHAQPMVVGAVRGVANYEQMIPTAGLPIAVRYEQTRSSLQESSLVLAASGTVVLECAILGRPTAVLFRTGWLNFQLAKRLVKVKHISLPNLIAGKTVFPEFIQDHASPASLADQVTAWVEHRDQLQTMTGELHGIVLSLGGPGFSGRTADKLGAYLP